MRRTGARSGLAIGLLMPADTAPGRAHLGYAGGLAASVSLMATPAGAAGPLSVPFTGWGVAIAAAVAAVVVATRLVTTRQRADEEARKRSRLERALAAETEQRRHAEEAAETAQADYRAMFENAVNGLFRMGLDGTLRRANRALAELLGYGDFDALVAAGRANLTVFAREPNELTAIIDRVRAQERAQGLELRLVAADGQELFCVVSARLVRVPRSGDVFLEGMIEDITARKQMEQELRDAKERADFASRTKSEFLANTSHELRTPLNAIIGFAEIIKDEMFGEIPKRQYVSYAADIHESGRHLLALINDILDMSKVEAGRRELAEEAVDVGQAIDRCIHLVEVRAREDGVTVATDIPEGLPLIWAEERAIKQILLNLLSNAVKFSPARGHVTVHAHVDGRGCLVLAVTDQGMGMSEADKERALTPFQQAESTRTRHYGGTGLGLPLAQSLAGLHGGTIELDSAPGAGTAARVTLPPHRTMRTAAA